MPQTAPPTISIFIPVYNRANYLGETLDSILRQTYQDFEIIIADDGSTDTSLDIAHSYAAKDPRIKVLAFPHRGEVETRNEAIAHSNPGSRFLLNHDSDDISLPRKLEKLVGLLDACPTIAIAGCQAVYFNDQGETTGQPEIELSSDKIRASFGKLNSMINSAALIRREVFATIGAYREEFRSVDDYDFFSRALIAGFHLANHPEILHLIRIHPTSVGSTKAALQQELALKIQANYREAMGLRTS